MPMKHLPCPWVTQNWLRCINESEVINPTAWLWESPWIPHFWDLLSGSARLPGLMAGWNWFYLLEGIWGDESGKGIQGVGLVRVQTNYQLRWCPKSYAGLYCLHEFNISSTFAHQKNQPFLVWCDVCLYLSRSSKEVGHLSGYIRITWGQRWFWDVTMILWPLWAHRDWHPMEIGGKIWPFSQDQFSKFRCIPLVSIWPPFSRFCKFLVLRNLRCNFIFSSDFVCVFCLLKQHLQNFANTATWNNSREEQFPVVAGDGGRGPSG